jgi:hypothetical protein
VNPSTDITQSKNIFRLFLRGPLEKREKLTPIFFRMT